MAVGTAPVTKPFRFGVTMTRPRPAGEWAASVRRVEAQGFDVLTVPDHLDDVFPPVPALAAAAASTHRLRLGTLVFNNDFRNPVVLASEAATLDVLSDERFELGLGAGHAFLEYERAGIPFDLAAVRVERLTESVRIVKRLLGGDEVTFAGAHYDVRAARAYPAPVQQPPPLLVGGWGSRLLALAAQEADIVGLTGTGKTLADGTTHAPDGFNPDAVDERVGYVRREAAGRDFELHALVQAVVVTDDRVAAATQLARQFAGLTVDGILGCPFVLVGTEVEIADELQWHRDRWGISYYTVFEPFADRFAPVVARVAR